VSCLGQHWSFNKAIVSLQNSLSTTNQHALRLQICKKIVHVFASLTGRVGDASYLPDPHFSWCLRPGASFAEKIFDSGNGITNYQELLAT